MTPRATIATFVLLLTASCATPDIAITSNTFRVPQSVRVDLQKLRFDYARWSIQDSEYQERVRTEEPRWGERIAAAFRSEAERLGLFAEEGEVLPVEITVLELNPGGYPPPFLTESYDAEIGRITVLVTGGTGEMFLSGALTGGEFNREFDRVLDELGAEAARGIQARQL